MQSASVYSQQTTQQIVGGELLIVALIESSLGITILIIGGIVANPQSPQLTR